MRVVNAVFSKQTGGLEQASLDYSSAFLLQGHEVTLVVGARSPFLAQVKALGCPTVLMENHFGFLDMVAIWRLRRWLKQTRPDAVFAHGNRAISLLRRAAWRIAPVIAVNHTRSVKRSRNSEYVLVVNSELKEELLNRGHKDPSTVMVVPNMVRIPESAKDFTLPDAPHSPPVFGVLCRFTPQKGLDVFIEALSTLKAQGMDFRAKIGGDGVMRYALQQLAVEKGVGDEVEFCGWVEDRTAFYRSLDVFCLPSREETFGIVILEAMLHKLPVITTNTPGPRELFAGERTALFVPIEDAPALAEAMQRMVSNWPNAKKFSESGFALLQKKYDIQTVAKQLQQVLDQVTASWKQKHGETR